MKEKATPFAPIELVVVQATSFCNMNCRYCYLTEETRKTTDKISLPQIESYFSKIFQSRFLADRIVVSWHSGEPLVLGTDYYEAAFKCITRIADDICDSPVEILHDFQSNGTLIDEKWCRFFRKYSKTVTVGISCDGPSTMHDFCRLDWKGSGTFDKTLRGIDLLIEHDIKFGLIAVVTPHALTDPDTFFEFFYGYRKHISEFRFNLLDQFTESGEFSYENSRSQYYSFLKRVLDRIDALDDGDELLNIKNFSYFYNRVFSSREERQKQTAAHMCQPLRAFNIATIGDVSTFYAGVSVDECQDIYGDKNGLVIGNLNDDDLDTIAASSKAATIVRDFRHSHAVCEQSCPYFELCPGGYNLIKYNRYGRFDVAETPECRL
ncbi:radical SAM protein, partial [Gammaproteobacteria bacterium]|nr:radical SAM protein [Gammaproteobacteria bacterium]